MATVIALDDIRRSPTACLFEGGDDGVLHVVSIHPSGSVIQTDL